MYTVTMPKKESMTIVVPAVKGRGRAVPASRTFKDKRRKPKSAQRAQFRKEWA